MKKILEFKKIVWIFILLLIFTGIFTYLQIPKRDLPEINVNVASITTVYPGASPGEVERTITTPMENRLLDVKGVDEVTSTSTNGFGSIAVTLSGEADTNTAYSKIRQVVSDVSRGFPDEVQDPDVNTDITTSPVATYHITGDDYEALYTLRDAMENWEDELTSISGVESLLIKGLPDQKLSLSLDQQELQDNQLSAFQIVDTVRKEMAPAAIGTKVEGETRYPLILEKASQLDELKSLPLKGSNDGIVTLSDVATLSIVDERVEDLVSYQGAPALSVTVLAKEGVNISALQDEITTTVSQLKNELPESVTVDRFYTQSTIIEEVFDNLISSFAISFFAVILIMVLGLPLSSALLVGIAIPISILIGFIPLPYIGVDLNQISVIGMIIAIGILVDDAIVVNDNIQRRYQLGDGPFEGALTGVREVGKSIVTSTLMIVFSFFPLTFLSGSNGDFILALPAVLIFTVLASTIVALTFIPTVQYARKLRQKRKVKSGVLGGFFNWLESFYADTVLPKTTKKPWLTAACGLLLCVALSLLAMKIPFEFFPSADRPEVTITVVYPEGTSIEESLDRTENMREFLLEKDPNITDSSIYTGSGLPNIFSMTQMSPGENKAQLLVRIDRETTSATTFINEWERPLREQFPEANVFMDTIVSGPPPSPPVQVKVQGPELDQLLEAAEKVKSNLLDIEGAEIAVLDAGSEQTYIQYTPDRELLAENNIPISQVTGQLQIANTGVPLGTFDTGTNILPFEVILDDGNPEGPNLDALEVTASNPSRTAAPPEVLTLEEVVESEKVTQTGTIPHLNGERTVTIEAYPEEGSEQSFNKKADQVIADFEEELPEGYTLVESGQTDAQTEFFIEVSKLFVIVLFLIYLTIAIQFNSLLMPLLITGTVFLAVTGAIIGLFVSGEPLSFLATLGIVSLSGIVVRNSVILVEFMEQNRNKYSTMLESVIEAGRARVRPIILTSMTSIAALTPIIFTGDVLFKPLAISIVSGLLFSTILTLLLVPAFYLIIKKVSRAQ
ncbi:efflux RND transporter permease subunit [Halobacillus yeomjeoni]|uniref:efflux RND transporter permease subunit n=1 Tax=Halobacillus yeomjeoni TaxID=311194 RepID=UPI001CD206FF|nr:efflux RND transporter permease subunit [Halobacillus yeomjeoni]MCA0983062.1 efflux RND transporter permease subunit [Halobacillus yeomjeoni]